MQERLVWKDFNIEDEAHAAQKPHIISIYNVTVTDNILEIRLYWAGKGTTRIPDSGDYGPLISAFSIVSGESYNNIACVLYNFNVGQLFGMRLFTREQLNCMGYFGAYLKLWPL